MIGYMAFKRLYTQRKWENDNMSNTAYEMFIEQLTAQLAEYFEDEDNRQLFEQWEREKVA